MIHPKLDFYNGLWLMGKITNGTFNAVGPLQQNILRILAVYFNGLLKRIVFFQSYSGGNYQRF